MTLKVGDLVAIHQIEHGLVHLTAEAAIAHAEAILESLKDSK